MFCPYCGKTIPDQSQFCAYCGKSISLQSSAPAAAPRSAHACPRCGKDDRVQKVSSIFSGGVSQINYEDPVMVQTKQGPVYGMVNRTAVNYTDLARRLAPPAEPEAPGKNIGCWTFILAFAAAVVAGFFAFVSDLSETVTTVIGLGAFFLVVFVSSSQLASKQQQYKKLYPVWQQLMSRWSALYYCSRDDCVYDPASGKSVSADRTSDLVYR